ncbi:MAG TPA: hypothetical protein DCE44_17125 [Verrucomicrobiales bacterium]|nr:hypothetical protein [Verrucomicrobiales bacterium]
MITIADTLTEQNIIVCRLGSSPTANAPGVSTSANILIYDGPLWSVLEIAGSGSFITYDSAGLAVNAGVIGTSGAWATPPQAVGWSIWKTNSSSPALTHGALWTSASIAPATDFGLVFRPYGISFRASTQAVDRAKVVGSLGTAAYRMLDNASGGIQLPHFDGTTGPSLAWGISPNAARSVGYSSTAVSLWTRPALWVGTSTPVDLSVNFSAQDIANVRIGEAKAVNDAGVIVGYCSLFLGNGDSIQRPFSNTGNGALLTTTDWLQVPDGYANATGEGVANAVSLVYSGDPPSPVSRASGSFRATSTVPWQATIWGPNGAGIPEAPVDLQTLKRVLDFDPQSEALGINSKLRVVGWSGVSATDPQRKAVFHSGVWKDLNDRHFTHGSGWELQSAHAISDTDVIVGVGTLSGSPRGFLLIPRTAGP